MIEPRELAGGWGVQTDPFGWTFNGDKMKSKKVIVSEQQLEEAFK